MPGAPPDGTPVPADGALPPGAIDGAGQRPFGIYVHVPFCVTRCGYCDFNTYTAAELGPGASRESYAGLAIEEIRLARRVLGTADIPVSTVFFGGGTPTLLPPAQLGAILRARYCDPKIQGTNKTDGLTWKVREILHRVLILTK